MELVNVIRNQPLPPPPQKGELLEKNTNASSFRENADSIRYEPLKDNNRANLHFSAEAENVLWQLLRQDSTGYEICRQHAIDNYIADFVCLQKGLVIEVDGGYHELTKEADAIRTGMLNHWGFEAVRFTNDEVLKFPQQVFETIKTKIGSMPDHQNTLPSGEGRGGASL
ncbi:DUF559 domain-containing protein [Mucilaginibacter sp. PAMB04168]|uniref:endonuclease domain-containing protein n=1 Tax=Mucilaginibacter sp. PAMB04168 TaxID=3138567 RepID=UPI0031F62C80